MHAFVCDHESGDVCICCMKWGAPTDNWYIIAPICVGLSTVCVCGEGGVTRGQKLHSPKLTTSKILSDLSSATVQRSWPSTLTDIPMILPGDGGGRVEDEEQEK